MSFDFYHQYKDYSNIELLKIVKRPENYQPAAVAIATELLNRRAVRAEEIQLVDHYYQEIENSQKYKKEKMEALKKKASDFFEPVLHPSENVIPGKWLNILLFVLTIQYSWLIFKTIRSLISFFRCNYCTLDIYFFAEFFTLIYVPVVFYLLFKRRRWGWILLFADNLFTFIAIISQSNIFFKYQEVHHGSSASYLSSVLIRAAFVFFLWRQPIAEHFGITPETKKKTAMITAGATLIFVAMMYLIF